MSTVGCDKVLALANHIHDYIVRPQLQRIQETGSLVPSKSLRHKATRELFTFAHTLSGRWFTVKTVKASLQIILRDKYFSLPEVAGLTEEAWLNDQAAVLQALLVKAKKNGSSGKASDSTGLNSSSPTPAAMDDWETQPWPEEDVT